MALLGNMRWEGMDVWVCGVVVLGSVGCARVAGCGVRAGECGQMTLEERVPAKYSSMLGLRLMQAFLPLP